MYNNNFDGTRVFPRWKSDKKIIFKSWDIFKFLPFILPLTIKIVMTSLILNKIVNIRSILIKITF